jgi:hypothetical protein
MEGRCGLLVDQEREIRTASRVTLGPYIYSPAPMHSSAAANGTLTRGGFPVTLAVTEPLLRDFLEVMSALEADLTRRWVTSEDLYARSGTK